MESFKGMTASADSNSNGVPIRDQEGKLWYPPTQRRDGSWRKPVRVRNDYNPLGSEQNKYIIIQRRIGETGFQDLTNSSETPEDRFDSEEKISSPMASLSVKGFNDEVEEKENGDAGDGGQALGPALPTLDKFAKKFLGKDDKTKNSENLKKEDEESQPKEPLSLPSIMDVSVASNEVADSCDEDESVVAEQSTLKLQPRNAEMETYQSHHENLGRKDMNRITSPASTKANSDREVEKLKYLIVSGALSQQEAATAWNDLVEERLWKKNKRALLCRVD